MRYLWRPNGGTSAARNTGIAATTAPLIAFLDADDWWAPEKLAAQVAALESHPGTDVVYTAAMMVTEGTGAMALDPAVVEGDAVPSLLLRNSIPGSASSVMVRRALVDRVGGFDETVRYAEDWEYWLRLAKASPFARVETPHVFINVRPGSLGRNTENLRLGAHAVVDRAFAQPTPGIAGCAASPRRTSSSGPASTWRIMASAARRSCRSCARSVTTRCARNSGGGWC